MGQNDNQKLHPVIPCKIPDVDVAQRYFHCLGWLCNYTGIIQKSSRKMPLKWRMLYMPQEMHSSVTDEPLEQTCTTGKHFYGTEVMKSF